MRWQSAAFTTRGDILSADKSQLAVIFLSADSHVCACSSYEPTLDVNSPVTPFVYTPLTSTSYRRMLQRMTRSAAGGNLIEIIDRYRDQEGISDAEVARRIGLSRQNLHIWRSRGVNAVPKRETLQAIANGVDTTYAEVLSAALADTGHVDEFGKDEPLPDLRQPQQLGDFATLLLSTTHRSGAVSLCQPTAVYEATAAGSPDLTRWRVYLHLTDADNPAVTVIGGFAEFTVINIPANVDLAETLSPSPFAKLFLGGELSPDIAAACLDEEVFNVIAVEHIYVDPALRGNTLGPWLVTDIVSRMADSIAGLLAIRPTPAETTPPQAHESQHMAYWRAALNITTEADGFLFAHTAFTGIANAARGLRGVRDDFIAIDIAELDTRMRNADPELWPITNLIDAGHTPHTAVGVTTQATLHSIASDDLDKFKYILDSVPADDPLTDVSVVTMVSFKADPLAVFPERDLFSRAADYLDAHPDLGVTDVRWRESVSDDGMPMCVLDVEIAPLTGEVPTSDEFSPGRVVSGLDNYPWIVWRVTLTDPERTAGDDVAARTDSAARLSTSLADCVFEYCVDDDEMADGTKYYAWIVGVPQLKHRHHVGGTPTAILELIGSLDRLLPPEGREDRSWSAGIDLYATHVRNNVDKGY